MASPLFAGRERMAQAWGSVARRSLWLGLREPPLVARGLRKPWGPRRGTEALMPCWFLQAPLSAPRAGQELGFPSVLLGP